MITQTNDTTIRNRIGRSANLNSRVTFVTMVFIIDKDEYQEEHEGC